MNREFEGNKSDTSIPPNVDECSSSYLDWATDAAWKTEVERGHSLERLANTLLTCISILCVALVSIAPNLFSFFFNLTGLTLSDYSRVLIFSYFVILGLLAVAFLLSLLSQMRFRTEVLESPMAQKEYVCNEVRDSNYFSKKFDTSTLKAEALQHSFESLENNNEKKRLLLKGAMILVVTSLLASLLVAALFIYIILL